MPVAPGELERVVADLLDLAERRGRRRARTSSRRRGPGSARTGNSRGASRAGGATCARRPSDLHDPAAMRRLHVDGVVLGSSAIAAANYHAPRSNARSRATKPNETGTEIKTETRSNRTIAPTRRRRSVACRRPPGQVERSRRVDVHATFPSWLRKFCRPLRVDVVVARAVRDRARVRASRAPRRARRARGSPSRSPRSSPRARPRPRRARARRPSPSRRWRVAFIEEPYYAHWARLHRLAPPLLRWRSSPGARPSRRRRHAVGALALGLVPRRRRARPRGESSFAAASCEVKTHRRSSSPASAPAFDGYRIAQLSDLHIGGLWPRERALGAGSGAATPSTPIWSPSPATT